MTNRKAQRTFHDPITYKVGADITQEQYDNLVVRVADWFREFRPGHPEPAADARFRIKCCLDGKTLDGKPWYSHWQSTFATRMKMLARFDPDAMQPCRTGNEKKQVAREKARDKETRHRLSGTAANDPFIPPLTRAELKGSINYGDNAMAAITEAEQLSWQRFHHAYTDQFPELKTINAEAELSLLCDLHVVHERNRLKLLKGEKIDPSALNDMTRAITDLKKGLGIHPDQLAKRVKEETGGSIGEAVARLEAIPNIRELKDKLLAEEWLLLYQMFNTPSPRDDMGGYQLDEVGLFAHTRCRTCHCAKCGTRNFVGFDVAEVEAHLVATGALTPVAPAPTPDPVVPDAPDAPDAC